MRHSQPASIGSGHAIDRRGLAVYGSKVVVEEVDIASGHLERGRAVAEDPLE
jgi:hypothetical protein